MHLTSKLVVLVACLFVLPMAGASSAGTGAEEQSAASTLAAAGAALARDKNCLACHQIDSRRVGPPLASVAQRYGPPGGARDYLAKAIRQGGRGKWGAVPMPAQPQVSEQEAHQLADWILALPVSTQSK